VNWAGWRSCPMAGFGVAVSNLSLCYHSISYANFTDWWSRPRLASSPRHSVSARGAPQGVAEERGSVSYINGVDLQSRVDWGTPVGCIAIRSESVRSRRKPPCRCRRTWRSAAAEGGARHRQPKGEYWNSHL